MNTKRMFHAVMVLVLIKSYTDGVGASDQPQARHWNALYAFGDSYSDTGAGYVDGNGLTAIAYLAEDLSISFTYAGDPLAEKKSLNFAVSGAKTGESQGMRIRPASESCGVNEALLGRGMKNQVDDFVGRVRSGNLQFDPSTTLFFLEGGGNDESLATSTSVANLESELQALYSAGARYFLVALLPEKIPGVTPGVRLNSAVRKIPHEMSPALPGAHIALSRWGLYYDRIIENPAKYGIVNTKDPCAGRALFGEDPTPCSNPEHYFFFHEGHPSTAAHRIVGAELKEEVAQLFRD